VARRRGDPIHGWLALDKPTGMGSTTALAQAKRLFGAAKAGHAGTLDPLATGVLPVAFGEATKTVPYLVGAGKTYRFTIRWGEATDTDDAEGAVVETSPVRPSPEALASALARFVGTIDQVPPRFSAVKFAGQRAYDLARGGESPDLKARPVRIDSLEVVGAEPPDRTSIEMRCGKGAYVRALVRDLARALGTVGHVAALRRTRVGPFGEAEAISLARLAELSHIAAGREALVEALHPVATVLDDIPALAVGRDDAARLRAGQPVILRGRDAPVTCGAAYAVFHGALVAIGEVAHGELRPTRVFNLPL
jgi:tRNA pseudouridine55 synthase